MVKYLSSIQIHDASVVRDIAIRKNISAQFHVRHDLFYIEVFGWQQSTSSSHCKAVFFLGIRVVRYIFLALNLNFLMTLFQYSIRLLLCDRLLAFSKHHMLIYSFVTVGGAGVTPPVVVPHDVTEPLWKLPFTGTQLDCFASSPSETPSYFVVNAGTLYGSLFHCPLPHDEHQTPHFNLLMESDSSKHSEWVFGFQKGLIQ